MSINTEKNIFLKKFSQFFYYFVCFMCFCVFYLNFVTKKANFRYIFFLCDIPIFLCAIHYFLCDIQPILRNIGRHRETLKIVNKTYWNVSEYRQTSANVSERSQERECL